MSIWVDYEQCKWNGKHKHYEYAKFFSLEDLGNWLFRMMRVNYTEDVGSMGFSMIKEYEAFTGARDNAKPVVNKGAYPYTMEFVPDSNGKRLLIHKIARFEDHDGEDIEKIIFSDGMLTAGQKFWNKEVRDWMQKCYDRQMHPKFNFAYDDEDSDVNDKQMA